ncbi:Lrp/AsnC family transcriptional regulator [Labrys sp. LIt4]|uniref:ArsR family transcriptional regulator n=1 Tax=Labrys okinawensis TaxID=346911 RepID=A0A2S9QEJ9_9HYPH|nr:MULTISPECIES: Lrp/AsnC family transcriptional regulator [Labrys]MBP0577999.1 Lrp/AsnC family transcriptional regulator [Labrys sp. LIt4]PRH87772.1 ArsR family transcriptional regulator [Labrys okinawensis]
MKLDQRDKQILAMLQLQADHPLADLAEKTHLSPSACWRRIKRLEEEGYILRRAALLDRKKVGVPTTVYVMVRTANHSLDWLERFRALVADTPEIIEMHRLTGDIDYLLKIVLPDVESLDLVYKKLVAKLQFNDISSYISMEMFKDTTVLPLTNA